MKDEFIDESQFDVDSIIDEFFSEEFSENSNQKLKNVDKKAEHELHSSTVISPEDIDSRKLRIGRSISTDVKESTYLDGISENLKRTGIQQVKNVSKKQDLILMHKKKAKINIGPTFVDTDDVAKEDTESDDVELANINKPKKDLQLVKSKFSETPEEEYSWSMEALGVERTTTKEKGKEKSKGNKSTSKKDKERDKEKLPVLQIIIALVMVIVVGGVIVNEKSGKSFGFLSGQDMHPTLTQSSFYMADKVTDYSTLTYMDIVLYEVNDEKIPSRIIGFPGDTVTIRPDGVYLNDKMIDPNFIGGEFDYLDTIQTADDTYKFDNGNMVYLYYKIPEDSTCVFLLGDNHMNSRDSIIYGPIDVSYITDVIKE